MITTLLTLFLVGLGALFVIGIVLALVGVLFHATLALAAFLLFKVLPLVLLGYVVVRLLGRRRPATNGPDDDILA